MSRSMPRGGGALLAFSILAGVLAGAWFRETSIGFLAGLGVGLALLGLMWLRDRR